MKKKFFYRQHSDLHHFQLRTLNSIRGIVRLSVLLPVGPSIHWSVMIKSKSGKMRISAPAHLSATGGRVSGLVALRDSSVNFRFSQISYANLSKRVLASL